MQVRVHTRGKSDSRLIDDPDILTVLDLKRRLNSTDPSAVLLTFKDKVLNDSTPLTALGSELDFVMESEIEFTQIDEGKSYKATVNGQVVVLAEHEVFFKDGKSFMVTKRTKKLRLKDVVAFLRKNVTRAQLVQVLFLAVVVLSRNYPLLVVILTINLLRAFSYALLRSRIWMECRGHVAYSAFMFVASLLSIDHEKFVRRDVQ